jgi:hypothetical protein
MTTRAFSARLLAAGAVALVCSSALHAQAPAAGPWAKVPALPTTCYQGDSMKPDPFFARVESAKAAVAADRERQEAVNAKIAEAYGNIDPMQMASRMQQWMMSNPQQAMAYMQAAQAVPADVQATLADQEQQRKTRDAEWKALVKRYDDARRAAYAPGEARWKAVNDKLGLGYSKPDQLPSNVGWDPGDGAPAWAVTEGNAIRKEFDRAYQAICPQWWGPTGHFAAYMKREKTWFQQKRIPYLEAGDAAKLQTYAIMNTPAATYRSTAAHQAVEEYLDLAWKVYQQRDVAANCPEPQNCGGS